jgi:cyclophilin family peptidyl-prolyl cis-trans isomerase/protein-disulfide isomerase
LLAGCAGVAPTVTPPVAATPLTPSAIEIVTLPPATRENVSASDQSLGSAEAYLSIALYGDFQDATCAAIARTLLILRQRYPNDVRIVWRHFPQPANDKAYLAAQASEAAAVQGKFWEMHDQLLADQANWVKLSVAQFRTKLDDYARLVGLADLKTFDQALDAQTYASLINKAVREAQIRGFRQAPALLFQDDPYAGRIDEFALDNYARLILLEKRQFKNQPSMQIKLDKQYTVTLITEKGNVSIELYTRAAPVAVNNFVFLARQGWYDNITFFLVTRELVQTGDPSDTGLGTAGYNIFDERDNGLIFDREGVVAMANQRGVSNSSSSRFFITLGPLAPEGFNGQYTIFGQVTQGMDVLRKLTPRDTSDPLRYPNPPPGDRLIRVEITESP